MSTLAQRIQNAQQRIVALEDRLTTHLESNETMDDAATATTDQLTSQLDAEKKSLESMKRAEAHLARASTGTSLTVIDQRGEQQPEQHYQVGQVTRGNPGIQDTTLSSRGRLFAVPEKKIRPSDYIFKAVTAAIKHYADPRVPMLGVLRDIYGEGEQGEMVRRVASLMITKAASIPADTTTSGWASNLVQTVIGDLIQSLLPTSIYPRLSGLGGSFTFGMNGVISLPARNTATQLSGAFIAQGAAIPVKQGAFTSITLTPKKMGVITTLTREITIHSIPAIEAIVRQAILEDTGVSIDTVLTDSTAADTTRPAGLLNGIGKITASTVSSIVGFIADVKALTQALITSTKGNIRAPAWIMNPGDVLAAELLQTTVGETPFREEVSRGTLLGYPIIPSTTLAYRTMILIDAADFITATWDTPNFAVSDQAVLHMEDTSPTGITTGGATPAFASPVRSLFQTDSIAIRMIMDINWALRRSTAVGSSVVQWTNTLVW